MGEEIDIIRKESNRNCDFCAFASDCKKRLALQTERAKNTNKGKGKNK